MSNHTYYPKHEQRNKRAEAAFDFLLALAIGLALTGALTAWWLA